MFCKTEVFIRLTILLFCLQPILGIAQEWSIEGRLQNRTAYRITEHQGLSLFDTLADLTIKRDWETDWSLDVTLRGRYEDRLEPDPYEELGVREAVLTRETDDYMVKLGRQQVVWGRTDGLRLLDVVNPFDFREFLLDDFADSRIPLWMLNMEYYREDDALQFLIIPDLEGDRLAKPGGEFFIGPESPTGIPVLPTKDPDPGPENWRSGMRWSRMVGDWDLSFNALYGWTSRPVPVLQLTSEGVAVEPERKRELLLGGSGDVTVNDAVIRFEAVFTPDAYLQSPSGYLRQKLFRYAIGIDWIKSGWLLSPQVFQEHVLNPADDLSADEHTTYFTFLIRKTFLQDKFILRVFSLYGPDNDDLWINPRLSYRPTGGQLEITLGADMFGGDRSGVFGRFSERDRVTLETTWRF